MKLTNKIASIVLIALLFATVYGLVRTSGRSSTLPNQVSPAVPQQSGLVDQSALETAQGLVRMPTMPAEQRPAQDALSVADQEMDLAFAQAVLDATQHPPTLSAEAKQMQ